MSKYKRYLLFTFIIIIVAIIINEIIPIIIEKHSEKRVFTELQEKANTAKKAVVGIILEKNNSSGHSYNGIGSGVIFYKNSNTYYLVTAKHVIDSKDSKYRIFTIKTKFSGKSINKKDFNYIIPDENYYKSLIEGKLEYVSPTDDLAILSFKYDSDLPVLEFSKDKVSKNDKIFAIGHSEGNRYKISYGYIKSNKENKEHLIEHNALIKYGNSGGPSINKDMKIVGINTSGIFTLLRHYRRGLMIPSNIVIKNIKTWQDEAENTKKEDNASSWTANKVKITVKDITKTSALLVIEDKNLEPTTWGMEYTIQKQSKGDNKWYDISSKENIEWLRAIAGPNKEGITKIKIDWSKIYGELKPGTYRLIKYNGIISIYSEPFKI